MCSKRGMPSSSQTMAIVMVGCGSMGVSSSSGPGRFWSRIRPAASIVCALEAAGLILLQNRPGPLDEETPIDPHPTITIALLCELLGIPLLEHIYVDGVGDPFFVAERGILKDVPDLVVTLREWTKGLAEKELLRGLCAPNYYDEQK